MKMKALIPQERIEKHIYVIRGHKVILDVELALLYEVKTGALNRALRRNQERFPKDFTFQLTKEEFESLKIYQETLKNQGGRRYLPYVFTEQGVAMLSSVLKSKRAVQVNIEIMRTFVRLREYAITHVDLAKKIALMEKNYDAKFKVVFDALRQLMTPPTTTKRKIGF